MKTVWTLTFLLVFVIVWPGHGQPVVKCDVKKVAQHDLLVTFSWYVTVHTIEPQQACDLTISFRDRKGREIYKVSEMLRLKPGTNTFEGSEICDSAVWKRITEYVTKLDCVF